MIAALAAATIGVCLTTGVVQLRAQLRLRRLVKAAERIADGDYTVGVTTHGGGLETRLGERDQPDLGLARGHPRPGHDRPADRRLQSPGPARRAVRRGRARLALRPAAVGRVRRHRPLQGRQRLVRPRRRRRRPARGRPAARRQPARQRPARSLRRRGVHADPDRDATSRRARSSPRSSAGIVERERFTVDGDQHRVGDDLDRDRRRVRRPAPDGGPRPRRGRRDVLGQVARPQPDLRLRRAEATTRGFRARRSRRPGALGRSRSGARRARRRSPPCWR